MVHTFLKPAFFLTVLMSISLPLQSGLATSLIPLVAKEQSDQVKLSQALPVPQPPLPTSPQAKGQVEIQGRPALEAAKKLPVTKRIEIASAILSDRQRTPNDLDYAFALILSGVPRNREAVRLLAKGILGNEYRFGDKVPLVLKALATEGMRGSSSCVVAWGRIHDLGLDVPQNKTLAYSWYRWGALVGNLRGIEETASALLDREGTFEEAALLLERLPPERRARTYIRIASTLADRNSAGDLARSEMMLLTAMDMAPQARVLAAVKLGGGHYSETARAKALAVLDDASKEGNAAAQKIFARSLWNSSNPRDIEKAVDLFRSVAASGDAEAVGYLAKAMTRSGLSSHVQNSLLPVLQAHADHGDLDAIKAVAEAYFLGHGASVSLEKAAHYRRLAAEKGDTEAQYLLGMMYLQASGVEHNVEMARSWFSRAADGGYLLAKSALLSLKSP
ncbi:MAG: tetratricopeptide repeat protein [Allorhizobium sp.]